MAGNRSNFGNIIYGSEERDRNNFRSNQLTFAFFFRQYAGIMFNKCCQQQNDSKNRHKNENVRRNRIHIKYQRTNSNALLTYRLKCSLNAWTKRIADVEHCSAQRECLRSVFRDACR